MKTQVVQSIPTSAMFPQDVLLCKHHNTKPHTHIKRR